MRLNLVAQVFLDVNGNPSAVKVYDSDAVDAEQVWWYFDGLGDDLIVTRRGQ
jgi:hypothetical protein